MVEEQILGTSKMTSDGKITVISDVREMLGVSGGAIIVFCKNHKGEILIRKGVMGISSLCL